MLLLALVALALLAAGSQTASAAVYDMPTSIAGDCSVAVDSQINSWLASVPDGNTARFGAGKCYGQNGTITLANRSGLTVDGNGSELRVLDPYGLGPQGRGHLFLDHGTNLTVTNLTIRGANQKHTWWTDREYQHGVFAGGVHGLLLDRVRVYEVYGDGISLEPGYSPYCDDPNRDVTVRYSATDHTGRNGVAVVFTVNTLITDSTFVHNYGVAPVDIEPDDPCWYVNGVTISRNTFDQRKNRAIQYHGLGTISNVTVTSDNVFKRR